MQLIEDDAECDGGVVERGVRDLVGDGADESAGDFDEGGAEVEFFFFHHVGRLGFGVFGPAADVGWGDAGGSCGFGDVAV